MTAPETTDHTGAYTFAEAYTFTSLCDLGCGQPATAIAKGCMDKTPTMLCNTCLQRGIELVGLVIHTYMRLNKQILICGDCHRPILNLDTHIDIRHLA